MSKAPKQTHLDYLFTTIDNDWDRNISQCGPFFRDARKAFEAGQVTEDEVRNGLGFISKLAIARAQAKPHAEKLFAATIDYVFNPDKVINLG